MIMRKLSKIIMLGGGVSQIEPIKWIKEAGFEVILIDKNPEAKARPFCSSFIHLDSTNLNELMQLAEKKLKQEPILAVHATDELFLTAAGHLNDILKTPGANSDVVERSMDKARTKRIFEDSGVPCPKGSEVTIWEEHDIDYPVVAKIKGGWAGEGIRFLSDAKDLQSYYQYCNQNAIKNVLIERYVAGDELLVLGYMLNGNYYRVGESLILINKNVAQLERMIFPSGKEKRLIDAAHRFVELGARALGCETTPISASVIVTKQDVYVLEITPIFPANFCRVQSDVTGKPAIKDYYRKLARLGPASHSRKKPNCHNVGGFAQVFARNGKTLKKVNGVDFLKKHANVKAIDMIRDEEKKISGRSCLEFVPAVTIFAAANSYDELDAALKHCVENISLQLT